MIKVTRLHGNGEIVVNADLIEMIEACPDTHITLVTKRMFVVDDSLDTVIEKVAAYRRSVTYTGAPKVLAEVDEAA